MVEIQVKYVAFLEDKDFLKAVKIAEEFGYDYDDAGKVESVRRLFEQDGMSALPEADFGTIPYKRVQ